MGRDLSKLRDGNECVQTVHRKVGPCPHSGVYWLYCQRTMPGQCVCLRSRQHIASVVYVGYLKSISNGVKLIPGEK